jgi:hypothetical protein
MKTNALLIILLPLFLISPRAQCLDFSFGVKGGMAFGWIGGKGFINTLESVDENGRAKTSTQVGFSGGIYFSLELIDYLAIQPEILFSSSGGCYHYTFRETEFTGSHTVQSVEIPVFLKPRIPFGSSAFYLLLGPDISLLISEVKVREKTYDYAVEAEIKPENRCIFGVTGGLGFEYRSSTAAEISVDLRYSRSLTEFFKNYEYNLNTLILSVGFGYNP